MRTSPGPLSPLCLFSASRRNGPVRSRSLLHSRACHGSSDYIISTLPCLNHPSSLRPNQPPRPSICIVYIRPSASTWCFSDHSAHGRLGPPLPPSIIFAYLCIALGSTGPLGLSSLIVLATAVSDWPRPLGLCSRLCLLSRSVLRRIRISTRKRGLLSSRLPQASHRIPSSSAPASKDRYERALALVLASFRHPILILSSHTIAHRSSSSSV